jgi:hypothetical protein
MLTPRPPGQHKRYSKPPLSKTCVEIIPPKQQHVLVAKNKRSKPDVEARTKDLRLKGSDLYVARLGSCNVTPPISSRSPSRSRISSSKADKSTPLTATTPKSEPSSLYDELSPFSRSTSHSSSRTADASELSPTHNPEIRASRPCYRCVSAMHAVCIFS